jgi:dipeptidyl aminopeptidase/acylaminoacyl peptidase
MTARLASQDLSKLRFISDPRVCPAGDLVAAVVTRIVQGQHDEPPRYQSEIHLFDFEGNSRLATAPAYSDTRPRFAPDGSSLAFLRRSGKDESAQLVLVPVGADAAAEVDELTEEPGDVESFEWHPTQKRIAFLSRAKRRITSTPVSRTVDRLAHKLDAKGFLPSDRRRLRLLDIGGEARDATRTDLDFEEVTWSVDGRHLFAAGAAHVLERDEDLRRLWRLDADERGSEPVEISGPMHMSNLSSSPDGDLVAFVAPARSGEPSSPATVWVVSTAGGEPRSLSAEEDLFPSTGGDCRYGDYPNRPRWSGGGRLLVNRNRKGASWLTLVDVADGSATEMASSQGEVEASLGASVVTAFDSAAGLLALVIESSSRPGELYLSRGLDAPRRLSALNDELVASAEFVTARGPFAPDPAAGAEYWRLDPARPRSDGALVVQVHGGPHTNVGHGFYFEYQLLAARGYTVIYGNPRGSSSYGNAFATSILGCYGTVDADDIIGFTEDALARHQAQDAPVHLTGGSYGGFMTNWLVAHTERFRSAVTQRGICNFTSFYGTSDIGYRFTERELRGTPWDDPERLWQQSPLRLAHRIATPLLIVHSESDLRCPVEQAQQLFVAVRRSGNAETKLILFPEESHELSRSGRPDRRVERLDAIIGWFESHP